MSFRKLAAVLLAGGLALAACGQQTPLGSTGASAPPVASGANFPAGSTMAKLAAAGTGPETLKTANARVCSVSGSTPAKTITQYVDQANIVLFDVYSKCADALRNGQVEAVTTDNVILSGLVSTSQGAFKLVGKPF